MTGRGFSRFTLGSLFLLILLLGLPLALAAQEETESPVPPAAATDQTAIVTVTGAITNGTAGGTVPADVTVELRDIGPDGSRNVIPAIVGTDGTFTVADVAVAPDHLYVAVAVVGGVVFSSDVAAGAELLNAVPLPITIFDVTDDPSVLSITQLQAQAAVSMNQIQLLELYTFSNNSDRAYRAPDGASVRVTVPEGAEIFDMGTARFTISEDGRQMIDNAPVMPGEGHTVHVLFGMPYPGQVTVRHPVSYPLVNGFEVVINDPGLTVTADGIEPLGGRDMGMAFGVQASLPAGSDVVFTVSGTPAPAATPLPPGSTATGSTATVNPAGGIPPLSLLLMVIGGACVGVALVLFFRDRRRKPLAPPVDPRVNALVQQIAELDVAFQAGSLGQEDYDTQRAALKSQLLGLARDGAEG